MPSKGSKIKGRAFCFTVSLFASVAETVDSWSSLGRRKRLKDRRGNSTRRSARHIYDFSVKILFQEFKTQCKLWLKNISSLSKPQTQILTCFAQNPAQKSLSSCHNCRSQILVPLVSNLRRGRQTRDPCARWLALWIGVCQMCKDLNPR